MGSLSEIGSYISALLEHWAAFATGGVFTAVFVAYERWRGTPVAWPTYFRIFIGFGFVAASFLAWQDERLSRTDGGGTEDLKSQIAKLSKHRWQPLSETQISSLRIALRNHPAPRTLRIVCGGSDCVDLTESLSELFNGIGWQVKPEYGLYFDAPTGIAISQKDIGDRSIADALEKWANFRVTMSPSELLSTTIFIGMKPLP
jgi:hypothetical protein